MIHESPSALGIEFDEHFCLLLDESPSHGLNGFGRGGVALKRGVGTWVYFWKN